MKINWKLRLQNKATLTAIISAIIIFIGSISTALGFDLSGFLGNAEGIATSIISLLVLLGVVVDPTSKGVGDSGIAQTYDKPRDSGKEEEKVDWIKNSNEQYNKWDDSNKYEVTDKIDGLRHLENNEYDTIRNSYDSDINNSGVMLDTDEQVGGVVNNGENTGGNQ